VAIRTRVHSNAGLIRPGNLFRPLSVPISLLISPVTKNALVKEGKNPCDCSIHVRCSHVFGISIIRGFFWESGSRGIRILSLILPRGIMNTGILRERDISLLGNEN